jgi:hypothetical protein
MYWQTHSFVASGHISEEIMSPAHSSSEVFNTFGSVADQRSTVTDDY